ncbi:hypothetical protein GCM10020331_089000 [Ectobacillus funiculus]
MLTDYIRILNAHEQYEEATIISSLLDDIKKNSFFEVIPTKEQADPSVSTE